MKHLLLTTIAAAVLVGCGPPDISIYRAAGLGNIEAVKQHLAAGTDVDAKDNYDYTPLHIAARLGQKEIAEVLIAAGADVNAKMMTDETPLDVAIYLHDVVEDGLKGKFKETAALLRKHGGKTGEELKAEGK